jgi:hypothetical protein
MLAVHKHLSQFRVMDQKVHTLAMTLVEMLFLV